ncbi:unnamed protein product [Rhizopus stolonifer]
MKEGFKSIEIEPVEAQVDFIGPPKLGNSNDTTKILKGEVRLKLVKSVKIRNMSIKFKGFSQINLPTNTISAPLLPKLKLSLFGKTTLPAGDHVIPWEIDIPNIYPRSLLTKRAGINYKVILSIAVGLTKIITTEYPIVIHRHLLPYKELTPMIETKISQKTIAGKFHYEIDAPQIICLQQSFVPMAIKYISFACQKPVQSIRTQLVQIELYKRQSPSKSDTDLSNYNMDSLVFDLHKKISEVTRMKDSYIEYNKRAVPAIVHYPDSTISAWKSPCLIRHRLHPYLACTIESPLVSIYHQLEVTFQFGPKFEDVKTKIPIIIASVPKKECDTTDTNTMRYAFEEEARPNYLPCRIESRASAQHVSENATQEDFGSVLRDNCMMPISSDEEDDEMLAMTTTSRLFFDPQYQRPHTSHDNHPESSLQRGTSPTPENGLEKMNNTMKKFASAFDLSTAAVSRESPSPEFAEALEERPRTTTPTMKRQHMYKKNLMPINVDLANGRLNGPTYPPPSDPLPIPLEAIETSASCESTGSDVLPALDRINHSLTQLPHNITNAVTPVQSSAEMISNNNNNNNNTIIDSNRKKNKEQVEEDTKSVNSEASSMNAPSLSSSATLSTNKSHQTLQSRPPSPVFSAAPGLPATIPLREHDLQGSRIEETFIENAMSPAMNTIASSTLLTPRTSYALRRRIALSTISSLTADSFQLGPSVMPPRGASLSGADSDLQSIFMINSGASDNDYYTSMKRQNSIESHNSSHVQWYMNASLPPIPTSVATTNRRLTKIYLEDSDDEENEEILSLPPLPPLPPIPTQESLTPPRLPRLSFGKDLSISLGIE